MSEEETMSAAQRPTVSVVICAYTERRWDDLCAAIASVLGQDIVCQLILVVDHNDELLARARDAFPEVTVVDNGNQRGLSGARNAGIEVACGTIVAFLDDDAVAQPGWLRELLRPYEDPRVTGVGGAVLPLWASDRPSWFPREFDWVVGCTYQGLPQSVAPVRNPIGANMSFRRKVFRDVGLFRPGVGRVGTNAVGCEETELCIRVHQRWPERHILYQPLATVLHRVPDERATWKYFLSRCYAEGRSKALVASLVGAGDGLSSERAYTLRTLPMGALLGLRSAFRGDRSGLARTAAIVGGFGATVLGYLRDRGRHSVPEGDDVVDSIDAAGPILVTEVALDEPLSGIPVTATDNGSVYRRALVLVRLHGEAIGTVEVALGGLGLPPREVAARIQATLGERITAHLRDDGMQPPGPLTEMGVRTEQEPACARATRADVDSGPFVSVVIPTRDRPEMLLECLDTLLRLRYPRFEVIVVDNAPSTDGTRMAVQAVADRDARVRYVREERAGLSRAKNRGLDEARGEVVAFTDDDVLVDPLWLAHLVRGLSASRNVACVTGLIFPRELETESQSWIEQFGGFGKGFERRVFDLHDHRPDGPLFPYAAGMFGSGANMAFRTGVLRDMGGFSPVLGTGSRALGGEDLAVTYETIRRGFAVVYEPSAIVHHLHHREYERLRRQVYGYGVGLTAYLAHTIFQNPRSLLTFARKLPLGIAYALNPWSGKNHNKVDYPRELTLLELRGMVYGPIAYWRSRRQWDERSA